MGQYPYEVLGSSETGGIGWRQQSEASTLWTALAGVELKLDGSGALAVKSPWLPDADWYVTADQGTINRAGGFSLGARLDRIVKVEGKRVSLPETESALEDHTWIEQCRVIVLQRRRQVVGAAIVLTEQGMERHRDLGHHLFTRELRHYLGDHLAGAAIPRVWRVATDLPRNAQGKIQQKAVEALFGVENLPVVRSRQDVENGCKLSFCVEQDSPYFEGHFRQAPILPGVVQLVWAQQFAVNLLGVKTAFVGMQKIKFRDLVFPQQELTLSLEYVPQTGRLVFQYDSAEGRHSHGVLLYEAVA